MSKLYSVIVPVYNSEKVIGRCIESILWQSLDDFELILVDDGSTDASGKICDYYKEKDQRIKVIHIKNSGVSSARNIGINYASGKYIVFVDSDDYVENTYLLNLNKKDYDLVISSYILEYENSTRQIKKEIDETIFLTSDKNAVKNNFEKGIFNYACMKRFKKSIIKEKKIRFDESINLGEDTVFVVDYLREISEVCLVNSFDYHYIKYTTSKRLSNSSLSIELITKLESANTVLYEKLSLVIGNASKEAIVQRIGKLYKEYIIEILNKNVKNEREIVRYLYKQYWFRESINDKKIFENDDIKFRMVLRTNSAFIFLLYKQIQELRKEINKKGRTELNATTVDNGDSTEE